MVEPGVFRSGRVLIAARLLAIATWVTLATAADADSRPPPLLPTPRDWSFNRTWEPRPIGSRDFYVVENGPYARTTNNREAGWMDALRENGLLDRLATGALPNRYMQLFDPDRLADASPDDRRIIRDILDHRWPFFTISYVTARGLEMPSERALLAMDELWLGDGSTEYLTYRLEPLLEFLSTGKFWKGSSSNWTRQAPWKAFLTEKVVPAIRREAPQLLDRNPQNHREARALSDLFMREYYAKIGRPVAWGSLLSPYYLALMPENVAVGQRNSSARATAQARGMMRTAGGGKFFISWQTAEEALRWMGAGGSGVPASFLPSHEAHGYPLHQVRYMMWRPFLTGANMFFMQVAPMGFVYDVEGDGHYELTALGEIARDILDFADTVPDRGVPIASVGLLLDYDRQLPTGERMPDQSYLGLELPFDEADYGVAGIVRELFPKHRDTLDYAVGTYAAPYGEIFDVLSPNAPGRDVPLETLESYPILFDLGGLRVDAKLADVLERYVRGGGSLVMNAADLGALDPALFGVSLDPSTRAGRRVVAKSDGARFDEAPFIYHPVSPRGAETLYTVDGAPLVTQSRVGKGHAILVTSRYTRDGRVTQKLEPGGRSFSNHPLLSFVPHLLSSLTAGSMPIELRCEPTDCQDLSWWVHRKDDSWLVFVLNYRQAKRFERRGGHHYNIIGDYEYEPISYDLVCQVPCTDVVDIRGNRNVPFRREGGKLVATDRARFGDIRVYELADHPIELGPRTRYVNHALGKPVVASSTLTRPRSRPHSKSGHEQKTRRFAPERAVDGVTDNRFYWQSGRGDRIDDEAWNHYEMPATLVVDLQSEKTLDHARIQLHHRPVRDEPEMIPRIVRYTVGLSKNGRSWRTVVDESANAKPLRRAVTEKWFSPTEARYAKLTVLFHSERLGAQVVEFGVYGRETETYIQERLSPWEPARAWLPSWVQHWPESKLLYLAERRPSSVTAADGGTRQRTPASVTFHTYYHTRWGGYAYAKALDARPPHRVTYAVPSGAVAFAGVAGFGSVRVAEPGVVYQVKVDGVKRYDSGPYYGRDALPVVVDLKGARTIELVVEDLADGKGKPRAYWGEPRFLMNGGAANTR